MVTKPIFFLYWIGAIIGDIFDHVYFFYKKLYKKLYFYIKKHIFIQR
jgi:hypothetical protein